jgi:hypothetical protein
MTNRTERGPDAHAGHDALLIAQFAAGDVDPRERAAAEQLVESCSECAQLATDLRLIAGTTAQLPEPTRPRDFTLSREQVDRLRRGGFLGRLGLGWVRTDFGRTLAAGLTTLGLAGLLIGVVPGQLMMGSSGAAAPLQTVGKSVDGANGAGSEAGQPAASSGGSVRAPQASAAASAPPAAAPSATDTYGVDITGEGPHQSQPDALVAASSGTEGDGRLRDNLPQGSPNCLVPASLAVLALGLGLFALRRVTSTSV